MIDLRSDTVTRPTPPMREAMARADVGDDVFGEDPTVNKLQAEVASILGKESALFVPSGTMANQLCIKCHTSAGDEIIAERGAHVFNYETGGAAFLSSVQIHIVDGEHGILQADQIRRVIRPRLYYMPRTRLVCLENTHNRAGGTIYPIEVIREIRTMATETGLRMHLDGARLWNACAATGISPADYASSFDSVSVCLSKGLGAPVGSVIAGSQAFIDDARHFRKIFGGGMRQAGVLAAAGLYALKNNRERLTEDHEHAAWLAKELAGVPGFSIDLSTVQSNIIIMDVEGTGRPPEEILAAFKAQGVLLSAGNYMGLRAVTHLDVSRKDVEQAAAIIMKTMRAL
ncbi:MAG: low-specificity L-threonine aldolase [Bacteroidota bacterium]